MGAYRYVAVDLHGKEQKGILEGDTPRQIRQHLRERSLLPVRVTEVETKSPMQRRRFALVRRVSALDLALLTRQLATLVRAGLPLEEALLAVSEHSERPRIKSILLGVRAKVLEGHTLASGLEGFPNAFPHVYHATVAAGEQAGKLDFVLEAACRLHRIAPQPPAEGESRSDLSNGPDGSGPCHRRAHARLCRAQGGGRL